MQLATLQLGVHLREVVNRDHLFVSYTESRRQPGENRSVPEATVLLWSRPLLFLLRV